MTCKEETITIKVMIIIRPLVLMIILKKKFCPVITLKYSLLKFH